MMLYHLVALWAGFILFSVVFYRDDPAAQRRQEKFALQRSVES
jgi:hypothetical protein